MVVDEIHEGRSLAVAYFGGVLYRGVRSSVWNK